MSVIRVGIIGVGATTEGGPGAWGATAHLPALLASPRYKVVAIANSSVESAKASIKYHNLDSSIRTYGSIDDIAQDPEIDIAVVSILVSKHYAIAKQLILAGKDVYLEWPLGANTAENEELADLAKTHNVKTIVGSQGRANTLTVKVKEFVDSGKLGTIVSSTVSGSFFGLGSHSFPARASYYMSKDSGGDSLSIFVGHFLDSFIHVLGNFKSLHSITKIAYPTLDLTGPDGEVVERNFPRTSPDHIFIHGTLESDAIVSINYREPGGPSASGVGLRWIITGTEGEIELTAPELMWQIGTPGATLRMRLRNKGNSEDVEYEDASEQDYIKNLAIPSKGVARSWEAFATGDTDKYATFEHARAVLRTIDAIRKGSL
ncbi:oxidoreductase family protein [Rutstroemia sp. NJR-2017a BBW]|nr:oxidoreductase family protein [Rutstroemia sp. NJR-2017a BBW]